MIKPDDYARIVNACERLAISDEDLAAGIEFYSDLHQKLRTLGEIWSWALAEAWRKLNLLEGYARARQERGK